MGRNMNNEILLVIVGTILCQLALMSAMVSGKEEYSPHNICFVFMSTNLARC